MTERVKPCWAIFCAVCSCRCAAQLGC